VLAVVKDLFLPWYNALRFLTQNAARLVAEAPTGPAAASPLVRGAVQGGRFVVSPAVADASHNAMDRWIDAAAHALIRFVTDEMAAYRLYTVVPRLVKFNAQLTNWYVRLNRRRLKGAEGDEEAVVSLNVLHGVLLNLARLMAPFTPFLAETQYQTLRQYFPAPAVAAAGAGSAGAAAGATVPTAWSATADGASADVGRADSVHYTPIPTFEPARINEALEARVARMQAVVEAGRQARDAKKISLKQPVAEVVVVAADPTIRADVAALAEYCKEELNCEKLTTTGDEAAWCTFLLEPNQAVLGKKIGALLPKVTAACRTLPQDAVRGFLESGSLTVEGYTLTSAEASVRRQVLPSLSGRFEAQVTADGKCLVAVDTHLDERLLSVGTAREICNRVQRLRKKLTLLPTDDLEVYYAVQQLPHGDFAAWQAAAAARGGAEEGEGAAEAGAAAPGADAAAAGAGGKAGGKGVAKGGKADAKGAKGENGGKGAAAAAGGKAAAPAGGKPTAAAAAAVAAASTEESTAPARAAAAAALHTAVVANQALISSALNLHLLPDLPSARPAHAAVVGTDEDVIGGARLRVTITRRALRFPADADAALQAAVREGAASAGVALEDSAVPPQVAAAASAGGGALFIGSGRPASEAVTVPTPGPANLPRTAAVVAAGAKAALVAPDASRLIARLSAPGATGEWAGRVDGVPLRLRLGTHFFGSVEAQLAAASSKAPLLAAWRAEGGEVAARLAETYAALG